MLCACIRSGEVVTGWLPGAWILAGGRLEPTDVLRY